MSIIMVSGLNADFKPTALKACLLEHFPIDSLQVIDQHHLPLCILHTPMPFELAKVMSERYTGLCYEDQTLIMTPCLFFRE